MTLVLVDTSVWIDHLHDSRSELVPVLEAGIVLGHPMVIGELALGTIRDRSTFLAHLAQLPAAHTATDAEILTLIEARRLHGSGLSLVDVHLLASALITTDARLWTRDRRLAEVADAAGVAFRPGAQRASGR